MHEIRSHTSMRGIAALLVIIYHYRQNLPDAFNPDQYTAFFASAGNFVDFFFMLSGFVIAYVYLDKSEQYQKIWVPYFRSRFARIYPLHLLTLLWMFLLYLYSGKGTAGDISGQLTSNLTLVQSWGFHDAYALNFPSWSISGEFAAYLVFPLIVVTLGWPRTYIITLAAASYLVIGLHEYLADEDIIRWERMALLRAVPAFFLGTIIYKYRAILSNLSGSVLFGLQLSAVIILVLLLHLGSSLILLTPIFATLIILTYEDKGWLSSMLSGQYFHRLGLISYTMYMLHIPVRSTGYVIWPKIAGGLSDVWNDTLFFMTCIVVTLFLSSIIFRIFEIPMRDKLRGRQGSVPKTTVC
jgi:peptidoglycan/LPS O-acetylase OafA/YrhL